MRRIIPEVRALYERVRRPAIAILVGLGMMAPLGASIITPESPEVALAAEPEASAARASAAESRAAKAPASAEKPAAKSPEKATAAKPAKEVASGPATKSSKPSEVTRFARQYRIPVSLAQQIHSAAVAEGIDPKIAFGLVQTESSFRRTAISSVGAVGYTQVLPSTANWIAPGTKRSDLFNTKTNLRVGFKYLNYLLDKYNGNTRLALTAYNRGPGTVDRLLKQGRNPENGYATKVLRAPRG